jgi:hypothetical protein
VSYPVHPQEVPLGESVAMLELVEELPDTPPSYEGDMSTGSFEYTLQIAGDSFLFIFTDFPRKSNSKIN